MADEMFGVGGLGISELPSIAQQYLQDTLHQGISDFASSALDRASEMGRDMLRGVRDAAVGAAQQFDDTVRGVGNQVDTAIRDGVRDLRTGITDSVNSYGQRVQSTADALRDQVPGDSAAEQAARGVITTTEYAQRFGAGVVGGIGRGAVSMVGGIGELGSTGIQLALSPTKRAEVGEAVVSGATNIANGVYEYGRRVVNDPNALVNDITQAGQTGLQMLRNSTPEQLGLGSGEAATYIAPFVAPARGLVTGARAGELVAGEGTAGVLAREGTEALTQNAPQATWRLQSPVYMDFAPGTQLNSGIPLGIRNPIVRETPAAAGAAEATAATGARLGERRISRELYDELRAKTPTDEIRDSVNAGKTPPYADPALPGRQVTGRLHADHVVPMDRITRMEGFDKLTREQQLQVLNNSDNFIGLSQSANTSRQQKTFAEWTTYGRPPNQIEVNPDFRARMMQRELEVESILQKQIDDFVQVNQATRP